MVFLVDMYGCESWTIRKAECQIIDGFELMRVLKTLESLFSCKEIKPVSPKGNPKGNSWIFIRRTIAVAEAPILWPPDAKSWLIGRKPWCWERLREGGEGDDRGWDVWMALETQWTWVCVESSSWWCTGRHGVLQFIGSQRVRHDWETELN